MTLVTRLHRGPKGVITPATGRKHERSPPQPASQRSRTSSAIFNRRRMLLSLPILAIIMLYDGYSDLLASVQYSIRRLTTTRYIHSIYTTKDSSFKMPDFPKQSSIPSYIAMCQELIRRETGFTPDESHLSYVGYRLQEDESVCMDWTAPHYNLLEIFSSGLLNNFLSHTSYRHDCYRTRQWKEEIIGCDATTIQQSLPLAFTEVNFDLVSKEMIIEQCKNVLVNYNPNLESRRVKSAAMHHPFLWPAATFEFGTFPTSLPVIPSSPYVVPLSGILVPLMARLERSSLEWANLTLPPPLEEQSGVIIDIDPSTTAIDPSMFSRYISDPSTITVLVSPICRMAYLQNGETCWHYAKRVVAQLKKDFPLIGNSGFEKTPGIKLESLCSTAGSWSRTMRAKFLLCPPSTPSCLLPALAKKAGTTALLLEIDSSRDATEFFTVAGSWNKVKVEVIDSSSVLPARPPPQPESLGPNGEKLATAYVEVQQYVDPDTGIPLSSSLPSKGSALSVQGIPLRAILSRFSEIDSSTPETNANAERFRREDILSRNEVASYNALPQTINENYHIPMDGRSGVNPKDVSSEPGANWMAGLPTTIFNPIIYSNLKRQRRVNVARILEDNQKYENFPITKDHVEIWCPLEGEKEPISFIDQDEPIADSGKECNDGMTSLIWKDGNQIYNTMPIKTMTHDKKTVTFQVIQTWKQLGPVSSIFTFYQSESGVNLCPKHQNVEYGDSVGNYTATCEHGVTPIQVFVYDNTFINSANDVLIPSICEASGDEKSFKLGYTFEVPCAPSCGDNDGITKSVDDTSQQLSSPDTPTSEQTSLTNPSPVISTPSSVALTSAIVMPTEAPIQVAPPPSPATPNAPPIEPSQHLAPMIAPTIQTVLLTQAPVTPTPQLILPAPVPVTPTSQSVSPISSPDIRTPVAPTPPPVEPKSKPTLGPTPEPAFHLTPDSIRTANSENRRRRRLQETNQGELVLIPAAEFKLGGTKSKICAKYRRRRRQQQQQEQ